jgi:hypothetical protein
MPIETLLPSSEDLQWIQGNLEVMAEFAAIAEVQADRSAIVEPSILDMVWNVWISDRRSKPDDPAFVIAAFAAAFGQYLVDNLGARWRVIEDRGGRQLALDGVTADLLFFPLNFVGKRYEAGERGFFAETASAMLRNDLILREGTPDSRDSRRRPVARVLRRLFRRE